MGKSEVHDRQRIRLLLTPTADHLFDKGLITFDATGKLIFSCGLAGSDLSALAADTWTKQVSLTDSQLEYMAYHREKVFRKPSSE